MAKSDGKPKVGGMQRILNAVLSIESESGDVEAPREQVHQMSQVKKSTFAVALSNMKKQGLITYSKDTVSLTKEGRLKAEVVETPAFADNGEAQEDLKKKHKIGGKSAALFDGLLDGKVHDRKEMAEEIGCTNPGTYNVMLSTMKKKGVIVYDKQTVQLSDACFPAGRPE